MRKLFRMKYEPCNGRCYEYDDVLKIKDFSMSLTDAAILLDRIIAIHEPACGNEHLAYGMDYDEDTDVFVTSFRHFGDLDLYTSKDGVECMNKLIDGALAFYRSDEGKRLLAEHPGKGHEVCEHGEDHDLRRFALRFSGLDETAQAQLLA